MADNIMLRVPQGLQRRLRKAAEVNKTSLSDEIRSRLEETLLADEQTQAFAGDILRLAIVTRYGNETPWHADPINFRIFRHGVLTLLNHYKPPGEIPERDEFNAQMGERLAAVAREGRRHIEEEEQT
jgi:hypothetical protein